MCGLPDALKMTEDNARVIKNGVQTNTKRSRDFHEKQFPRFAGGEYMVKRPIYLGYHGKINLQEDEYSRKVSLNQNKELIRPDV